ncbi:MAG: hypothetical protein VCA36_06055, partial [Opitutales bacterium]
IIAVFMPDAWLQAAVDKVEPMVPVGPLVEYVARGWSVFYFMLGGLIWLFSTDLPRYLPAIRWTSCCYTTFNGTFIAVLAWLYATREGWGWFFGIISFNVSIAFLFGLAMLLLSRKILEAPSPSGD